MAAKMSKESGGDSKVVVQLNLISVLVLGASFIVASGVVSYVLGTRADRVKSPPPASPDTADAAAANPRGDSLFSLPPEPPEMPAWGELAVTRIKLEQPEEYVAFEVDTNRQPTWVFTGMAPAAVRTLLLASGLNAPQADAALALGCSQVTSSNTIVHPDDSLVFGISAETRAKLYAALSHFQDNQYIHFPFTNPDATFEAWFTDSGVSEPVIALVRKLLYTRNDMTFFSDYEAVLRKVPTPAERMRLARTLSRQSAILVRLRVRPRTDLDKVIGYWDRGIQTKDVRPLLESLQRLPTGGSVSILHLLPNFARQRLYTFPLPDKPGDPAIDCHWTTMNFFNELPDNHFSDPAYTSAYVATNFYQVAAATAYGDVIFLVDSSGGAIHSAVHLAGDIVFTKNGNNFAQPWMLMHLPDLVARYSLDTPPRVVVYRRKNS